MTHDPEAAERLATMLEVADGCQRNPVACDAATLLRAQVAEIARLRAREDAAEKMAEALRERDGGVHDADCKIMRKRPPMVCTCGHGQARAALAAWDASREGGGCRMPRKREEG